MISNPGFSFKNIVGKHQILPSMEYELPAWGSLYEDAIVCVGSPKLKDIYSEAKPLSKEENSIALKFASINIDDNDEILDFCNKYGLLTSSYIFANFRNSYIFFNDTKAGFSQRIPLPYQEREWVITYKKSVLTMRFLIELDTAVRARNYQRIAEILCYICLDLTCLEFENDDESLPTRNTETYQYRHSFTMCATRHGYVQFFSDLNPDITEYILHFADDLLIDVELEKQHLRPRQYLQFDYPMWHHLTALFYGIAIQAHIFVHPLGKVEFSKSFKEIDLSNFIKPETLIALGRAAISDIFKEHLHTVFPEIEYANGLPSASWRIPTLLDAMFLELFFRFSPIGEIRKCADPKCGKFFEWSPSKPNQKYCDNICAMRVAKRNQRAREREKQKKELSE